MHRSEGQGAPGIEPGCPVFVFARPAGAGYIGPSKGDGSKMQITIQQKSLSKAVETAFRFVPTKSPAPILSGVKLSAMDNDTLIVGATDLECGVLVSAPAMIRDPGEAVIPARVFNDLVRKLPDGELALQTNDHNLQIKTSGIIAEFNGFSAEEYPVLDAVKEKNYDISLPYSVFRQVLDQTLYSISADTARTIFTGQLWQLGENELIIVATDIHRLAFRRLRNMECPRDISGIIPGNLLQNALRSFTNAAVNVRLSEIQVRFTADNITVFGRLIAGNYPDWRRMIPGEEAEAMCKAMIEPAEMLGVLSRVVALGGNPSVVRLTMSDSGIGVSGSSEIGTLEEHVRGVVNGDVEVYFNTEYLIDSLKPFSGSVEMTFYGETNPATIRADCPDKDDYVAVLLPVRMS